MSDLNEEIEHDEPPVAHCTLAYLGPVAPHWELRSDFGDPAIVDGFRARVFARMMLLPPHDPQFRRNRERVNRDAQRSNISLDWDPPELAESPQRDDGPPRG